MVVVVVVVVVVAAKRNVKCLKYIVNFNILFCDKAISCNVPDTLVVLSFSV